MEIKVYNSIPQLNNYCATKNIIMCLPIGNISCSHLMFSRCSMSFCSCCSSLWSVSVLVAMLEWVNQQMPFLCWILLEWQKWSGPGWALGMEMLLCSSITLAHEKTTTTNILVSLVWAVMAQSGWLLMLIPDFSSSVTFCLVPLLD